METLPTPATNQHQMTSWELVLVPEVFCGLWTVESQGSPSCHPAAPSQGIQAQGHLEQSQNRKQQSLQALRRNGDFFHPRLYSTNNGCLPVFSQNHPAPVPSYQPCGVHITP